MDILEIVEINYIDTDELDRYVHEPLKQWRDTASPFAVTIDTLSKRIWREDVNTRAVYYCPLKPHSAYTRPMLIIYVEYDEVNMTGRIELECNDLDSKISKSLIEVFNDVFNTYDPATAPLPFEVRCPHCKAKYVYQVRTGTVTCQNCAKSFDLEPQEDLPPVESDDVKEKRVRESSSRYIAVDRSKIASCNWCGTLESNNWEHGKYGGTIYCSTDCFYANSLETNALFGFCTFMIPIILLLPFLGYSSIPLPSTILIFGMLWFLALPFLYFVLKGNSTRTSRPKNSRVPK